MPQIYKSQVSFSAPRQSGANLPAPNDYLSQGISALAQNADAIGNAIIAREANDLNQAMKVEVEEIKNEILNPSKTLSKDYDSYDQMAKDRLETMFNKGGVLARKRFNTNNPEFMKYAELEIGDAVLSRKRAEEIGAMELDIPKRAAEGAENLTSVDAMNVVADSIDAEIDARLIGIAQPEELATLKFQAKKDLETASIINSLGWERFDVARDIVDKSVTLTARERADYVATINNSQATYDKNRADLKEAAAKASKVDESNELANGFMALLDAGMYDQATQLRNEIRSGGMIKLAEKIVVGADGNPYIVYKDEMFDSSVLDASDRISLDTTMEKLSGMNSKYTARVLEAKESVVDRMRLYQIAAGENSEETAVLSLEIQDVVEKYPEVLNEFTPDQLIAYQTLFDADIKARVDASVFKGDTTLYRTAMGTSARGDTPSTAMQKLFGDKDYLYMLDRAVAGLGPTNEEAISLWEGATKDWTRYPKPELDIFTDKEPYDKTFGKDYGGDTYPLTKWNMSVDERAAMLSNMRLSTGAISEPLGEILETSVRTFKDTYEKGMSRNSVAEHGRYVAALIENAQDTTLLSDTVFNYIAPANVERAWIKYSASLQKSGAYDSTASAENNGLVDEFFGYLLPATYTPSEADYGAMLRLKNYAALAQAGDVGAFSWVMSETPKKPVSDVVKKQQEGYNANVARGAKID